MPRTEPVERDVRKLSELVQLTGTSLRPLTTRERDKKKKNALLKKIKSNLGKVEAAITKLEGFRGTGLSIVEMLDTWRRLVTEADRQSLAELTLRKAASDELLADAKRLLKFNGVGEDVDEAENELKRKAAVELARLIERWKLRHPAAERQLAEAVKLPHTDQDPSVRAALDAAKRTMETAETAAADETLPQMQLAHRQLGGAELHLQSFHAALAKYEQNCKELASQSDPDVFAAYDLIVKELHQWSGSMRASDYTEFMNRADACRDLAFKARQLPLAVTNMRQLQVDLGVALTDLRAEAEALTRRFEALDFAAFRRAATPKELMLVTTLELEYSRHLSVGDLAKAGGRLSILERLQADSSVTKVVDARAALDGGALLLALSQKYQEMTDPLYQVRAPGDHLVTLQAARDQAGRTMSWVTAKEKYDASLGAYDAIHVAFTAWFSLREQRVAGIEALRLTYGELVSGAQTHLSAIRDEAQKLSPKFMIELPGDHDGILRDAKDKLAEFQAGVGLAPTALAISGVETSAATYFYQALEKLKAAVAGTSDDPTRMARRAGRALLVQFLYKSLQAQIKKYWDEIEPLHDYNQLMAELEDSRQDATHDKLVAVWLKAEGFEGRLAAFSAPPVDNPVRERSRLEALVAEGDALRADIIAAEVELHSLDLTDPREAVRAQARQAISAVRRDLRGVDQVIEEKKKRRWKSSAGDEALEICAARVVQIDDVLKQFESALVADIGSVLRDIVTKVAYWHGQTAELERAASHVQKPPTAGLLAEIKQLSKAIGDSTDVARYRKASGDALIKELEALGDSIGEAHISVRQQEFQALRAKKAKLFLDATMDKSNEATLLAASEQAKALIKGLSAVFSNFPKTLASYNERRKSAKAMRSQEGKVGEGIEKMRALIASLKKLEAHRGGIAVSETSGVVTTAKTVADLLREEEDRLRNEEVELEAKQARFKEHLDVFKEKYGDSFWGRLADRFRRWFQTSEDLVAERKAVRSLRKRAEELSEQGELDSAVSMLRTATTRAQAAERLTAGAVDSLKAVPAAAEAWRRAALDFNSKLGELRTLIDALVPPANPEGIRPELLELGAFAPPTAFDLVVDKLTAEGLSALERLAPRERALGIVRRLETTVLGDARMRLLMDCPLDGAPAFATSIRSLHEALLDLQRRLLMSVPVA